MPWRSSRSTISLKRFLGCAPAACSIRKLGATSFYDELSSHPSIGVSGLPGLRRDVREAGGRNQSFEVVQSRANWACAATNFEARGALYDFPALAPKYAVNSAAP